MKNGKLLNYKYEGWSIARHRQSPMRLTAQHEYYANYRLFTGDRSILCAFLKETRKGTVKNKELKSDSFQKSTLFLGVGTVLSGLFFSDTANATTLSDMHNLVGGIHGLMLADLDPSTTKIAINILGPMFASFNILFIVRIVMSWYPQLPVGKFPYVIAYAPTEPFLSVTRKVIPPVAGVDVSPVVWFAIFSFLSEILLGPQGLLVLISQQQL
jgi:YggT family protein